VQFTQPGGGTSGTVTFTGSSSAPAGTYTVSVHASDGTSSATQTLTLVVGIVATVGSGVDTNSGVNGKLQQFMATSFQLASWTRTFFTQHPDTTELNTLGAQHIRMQVLDTAIPWKANSSPQQASDWDFTELDNSVQPILKVTDNSPEFQIATAPAFMNSSGTLDIANHLSDFTQYCANLVRYYNAGGFTIGSTTFVSPSYPQHKITWWGIFNEYNINGVPPMTPSQYVLLYNTVVPAMLTVDPTIKISAIELADYDYNEGDPRNNLPTFVTPVSSGGVNAQVDIVSTHFYSSCNQRDLDTQLLATVPGFANDVRYIYQELRTRPDLANVPVWVTENNVNADYNNGNGMSACNPGQTFVTDQRGTSAFFAAWRPYVFSQLGKAGNQALYHWAYAADAQYGEVDYNTLNTYLSYWVDYWLARKLPWTEGASGTTAPDILNLNATESSSVETLATRNSDGSVVVMVANHAVHLANDDNGPGDPRTVVVDVSGLGNFSTAKMLTLGAGTNTTTGPTEVNISPSGKMTVVLGGYGVTFLTLTP
jgi:hypothetical protein